MTTSRDGRFLAVAVGGNRVQLIETTTGRKVAAIDAKGDPSSLAFSPDGRTLAGVVGTPHREETRIVLWEVATGKVRRELAPGSGGIPALAFSPDGRLLASGHSNTTILLWDLTGQRLADTLEAKIGPEQGAALWDQLAHEARAAETAMRQLTVASDGVSLLREHLRPAEQRPKDVARIFRRIAELDSDQFETREQASRALEIEGEAAIPHLRTALVGKPSLEVRRRVRELLDKLESPVLPPDVLRHVRAVESLERIGTPEARRLLDALAKGHPEARRTQEARAALQRLDHFSRRQP